MLLLNCTSKLMALQKALTRSFPESINVCGAVSNVLHKNPFRLQVLVDQWPHFTSVICRPPLEEMSEPFDPYNDAYFLFSKHPQSLSQMLHDPRIINWSRGVHLEVCQPELGEMLLNIGSKHGRQMQTLSFLLFSRDRMDSEEMEKLNNVSSGDLIYTSLWPQDAALVNDKWDYGGDEMSLKYVERCIENLPSVCVRKKELDQPIAWLATDSTAEINMAYTDPAYRNQGIARTMLLNLVVALCKRGAPVHCTIAADNKPSQAFVQNGKLQLSGEILLITNK